MSEYKIETAVRNGEYSYHVYKALGPWPFKNWSWRAYHIGKTYDEAAEWVKNTQINESPAGRAAQIERERMENRLKAKEMKDRALEHQRLLGQGFCYDAQKDIYFDPSKRSKDFVFPSQELL